MTFRTALWIDPGDTAGLVQRTVQDLVAVNPQPVASELVFIDTAPWTLQSLLVPVLIDLMTDRPCRYVEVFRGKVDFDVIRLAVGHKSAPGCRIFVGSSETRLRFGEIAQLQPGALIRIIPRGKTTARCVPLAKKVSVPHLWLRAVRDEHSSSAWHDGCSLPWSTYPESHQLDRDARYSRVDWEPATSDSDSSPSGGSAS